MRILRSMHSALKYGWSKCQRPWPLPQYSGVKWYQAAAPQFTLKIKQCGFCQTDFSAWCVAVFVAAAAGACVCSPAPWCSKPDLPALKGHRGTGEAGDTLGGHRPVKPQVSMQMGISSCNNAHPPCLTSPQHVAGNTAVSHRHLQKLRAVPCDNVRKCSLATSGQGSTGGLWCVCQLQQFT
jgi:hypothetical protein